MGTVKTCPACKQAIKALRKPRSKQKGEAIVISKGKAFLVLVLEGKVIPGKKL